MNKVMTTALLVVALGLGWLLGSQTGGGGDSDATDARVVSLQEENARLRRALGERGPTLDPGAGLQGTGPVPGAGTGTTGSGGAEPAKGTPEEVTEFDIATFDHPDKAFRAFLAYADTMLKRGPEGHLALLETINETFAEKPGERIVEQLLGDEDQAVRYMYPLIRFALNHDAQIVDMTETIFKTMAENPQRFRELDDDPLEMFTEGVAVMLPGMVDAKRLERFRGYAVAMLETPEDSQPRSVQRQRRDIQRAMESWAPPVSTEEALQRLRDGNLKPEEAASLLRRLGPEDVRGLDLDALVGPLLERDGWRVMTLISRLRPDPGSMAKLDARFLRAATSGSQHPQMVRTWLHWTGRRSWDKSRDFIEAGLQAGTVKTNGHFLMAAMGMRPPPDDEWIDWAERTYEFDDTTRLFLKRRRER
ncbi:MAG: hypothetical protein QNJ90_10100 [Planctomycetota bacterium]|nr:hypothetical protein [Planctomycetota bacterium]